MVDAPLELGLRPALAAPTATAAGSELVAGSAEPEPEVSVGVWLAGVDAAGSAGTTKLKKIRKLDNIGQSTSSTNDWFRTSVEAPTDYITDKNTYVVGETAEESTAEEAMAEAEAAADEDAAAPGRQEVSLLGPTVI